MSAVMVVGVLVGVVVGGGLVRASIPDGTGFATACYPTSGPSKGLLRVIDAQAGETCASGEKSLQLSSALCGFPRPGVVWDGCDLSGANVSNSNLAGASMISTIFRGTNLRYSDLQNANVTNAVFSGAYIQGVKVSGVSGMTSAKLRSVRKYPGSCGTSGPILSNVVFGTLPLAGFDLSGAVLNQANLTNAQMQGTNLRGASMLGANLTGANLTDADLTCTVFLRYLAFAAQLSNANLTGADLTGAVGLEAFWLSGVVWSNTTCPDATNSDTNGGTCVGHLVP